MAPEERVAWLNGAILPESEVRLSFRDLGFIYGDAVYDTSRTVNGAPFMFEEHVDRLFRSMRYVMIAVPYGRDEVLAATEAVAAKNRHLLGPHEDYWVGHRVSSGIALIDGEPAGHDGPTFLIECRPLPFRRNAVMLRDGVDAVVSSHRRAAPDALSANAKHTNCLNLFVGQREVDAIAPGAKAVLLDHRGYLAEGAGFNIFFVRDGEVVTPRRHSVLPGFGRRLAIELCSRLGVACREADISLFDAATSQEAFLTSTSLHVCPLRSFCGRRFEAVPGPTTARLMTACAERIGLDYVAQYSAHL